MWALELKYDGPFSDVQLFFLFGVRVRRDEAWEGHFGLFAAHVGVADVDGPVGGPRRHPQARPGEQEHNRATHGAGGVSTPSTTGLCTI